jgi:chromosome segregation ATPase
LFRKKIKTGPELISETLNQFDETSNKLKTGIELCQNQIDNNSNEIENRRQEFLAFETAKKAHNTSLEVYINKAKNVVGKIEEFLGV